MPYFDAFELGFRIFDERRRGKGIMTAALTLAVDFVFSSINVNRLEIRCDVDNQAAARIASKLGFDHEGTSRKAAFAGGSHRDIDVFALLRESWKSN